LKILSSAFPDDLPAQETASGLVDIGQEVDSVFLSPIKVKSSSSSAFSTFSDTGAGGAGVVYNVFDVAYRSATLTRQIPYYFVIDEAQEIGGGMRLESMLSEGAKFGARVFVLAQSLSMLKTIEGFEPVVQALLANTSTQAFFSPDPEDAVLIRATLSSTARFGITTLDLPTLHCWLRARVNHAWQPPIALKVRPLKRPNPERISTLIREVIGAHPEDYLSGDGWQERAVALLSSMVGPAYQGYLNEFFLGTDDKGQPIIRKDRAEYDKARGKDVDPLPKADNRLGF
jgi:hypothetical protein